MSNNPYSKAADAYGSTAATTDQRALEGKILLKAAQKLEALMNRLKNNEKVPLEEIGEPLEYNQKLWTLFINETMNPDHPLPKDIKSNIASLGMFVFKRTKEILIDTVPEKIGALIEINRNIASGLMKTPKPDVTADTSSPLATNPKTPDRPVEKSTDSMV